MYILKVKNKDLYINKTSYGIEGEETSYYIFSKIPEIFASKSDAKETLTYYRSGFGQIKNDIDDSTVKDLEIKKIEIKVL
jgi:hypothetical protein